MGNLLGPKYIPYSYMDPLGLRRSQAFYRFRVAIASQLVFDLPKEGGGGEWILVIRAWGIWGYIGLYRIL